MQAVNSGMPCIFSAIPMAIGVVTLLGTSDMALSKLAPKSAHNAMVETMPTKEPTVTPIKSGAHNLAKR